MSCAVLIIEDDDDLREALVESLADEGFRPYATHDGHVALEMLRDGRVQPAVIVLDLLMPLMDGITFLRHQDVEPSLRDIPVIVLSADRHHPHDLVDRAFAVLAKPISLDRLFVLVRQRCEASGHSH
jgi:two-component system, chemotaxis family, chemotaxis protein CheY